MEDVKSERWHHESGGWSRRVIYWDLFTRSSVVAVTYVPIEGLGLHDAEAVWLSEMIFLLTPIGWLVGSGLLIGDASRSGLIAGI